MDEIISSLIERDSINAPQKILWLRLYNKYGLAEFFGTYDEMAKEMRMNPFTVRDQISKLAQQNAVYMTPFYGDEGRPGLSGLMFQLIEPAKW